MSSLALTDTGIPLFPKAPHGRSAPEQRWGSAGGREHLVGGKNTNMEVPRTLRAKYPAQQARRSPAAAAKVRNKAEVVTPPTTRVTGFDTAHSKELRAKRTGFSRSYANEDGTRTTELSPTPLNYRDDKDTWQPIRTELREDADGWHNTADAVAVRIGRQADTPRLATVELPGGTGLSYGLQGAAGVEGHADGATVTYHDVLDETDLTLESQAGGVKETLVLRSADAPATFLFPLAPHGLTARLVDGAVQLTDAGKRVVAVVPAPFMEDSGRGGDEGAPARSDKVTYDLVTRPDGGQALRIAADPAWLHAPERVFPVRIDPSVDTSSAGTSAYVRSGASSVVGTNELQVGKGAEGTSAAYLGFPSLDEELGHHKIFGAQLQLANYDSASCKARPVSVHPVTEPWSAGTGLAYPGPAVGGSLASKSFAHGYIALGASTSACPAAAELFDLGKAGRDLVQRWADGTQPNYGLSVRASATDTLGWKKFAGHGTTNPPKLYVTHSPYNASYSFAQPVPDPPVLQNQNGQVKLTVTNKGSQTWTPGTYYLAYRAYDKTGKLVTQQRAANLTTNVAYGAKTTLTATIKALPPRHVPARLQHGPLRRTGLHRRTSGTRAALPPGLRHRPRDPRAVPAQRLPGADAHAPTVGRRRGHRRARRVHAPVQIRDLRAGRRGRARRLHDLRLPAEPRLLRPRGQALLGQDLPVARLRQGREQRGAHGARRDAHLRPAAGDHLPAHRGPGTGIRPPGGQLRHLGRRRLTRGRRPRHDARTHLQQPRLPQRPRLRQRLDHPLRHPAHPRRRRHGKRGHPLPGRPRRPLRQEPRRHLRTPARPLRHPDARHRGRYVDLRDKSGTTYAFSSTGLLVRTTDATSNVVTYTYSGGRLAKAENPRSARSLTFTWTGAHVTRVTTTPVDGAPLAWTYSYTGDVLDKVCDPAGGCTGYDYTSGSHYAAGVRDTHPESYWRLGDSEGTSAESTIEVNLGKDRGTY